MNQNGNKKTPTRKEITERKFQDRKSKIMKLLPELRKGLPAHIDHKRFVRICLTEIRKNPKLLDCTQESLFGAIMISAQLGLEPGILGQCYFIPYWNKTLRTYEVNFQIGYKGYVDLCRNSGDVTVIYAEVVYEKDFFEFEQGLENKLVHRRKLTKNRGELLCAYAVAKMKSGETQFVVLDRYEIEKLRAETKSMTENSPWVKWEPQMWKKSAIRQLSNQLPLSTKDRRAVAQDETTKHMLPKLSEEILDEPDMTDWTDSANRDVEENGGFKPIEDGEVVGTTAEEIPEQDINTGGMTEEDKQEALEREQKEYEEEQKQLQVGKKKDEVVDIKKKLSAKLNQVFKGDEDAIADCIERLSEFKNKKGEFVAGIRAISSMTDARAKVVYGKLKKETEESQTS